MLLTKVAFSRLPGQRSKRLSGTTGDERIQIAVPASRLPSSAQKSGSAEYSGLTRTEPFARSGAAPDSRGSAGHYQLACNFI